MNLFNYLNLLRLRLPLKLRVFLLTIIIATVVLVIGEKISQVSLLQALENEIGGQINKAAQSVVSDLKLLTSEEALRVFNTALNKIRLGLPNILRVDIHIIKAGKIQLLVSSSKIKRIPEEVEVMALKSAKTSTYMIEENGKRKLVAIKSFPFKDKKQGLLTIICSLKPFKNLFSIHARIRNYTLLVTIMLLVIFITMVFQNSIYNSVRHIVEVMRKFKQGEVKIKADENLPGEFSEVAKNLNRMLSEINQFQDNLQSQIKEATDSLVEKNLESNNLNLKLYQLQKQVRHSEKLALVGQLTSTFAHEIGSPLSAVATYLQLLQEEKNISPDVKKRLDLANMQINRVCGIVENLLNQSRSASDLVAINLTKIIKDISVLLEPMFKIKKIKFNLIFPRTDFFIRGNAEQIQQLFLNLLNNSLEAINESEGIIEITGAADKKYIKIEVKDNGGGIYKDKLKYIFDPFFTTKNIKKGSGLGLTVCKEIINFHRGYIKVKSEYKNTVVTLLLPKLDNTLGEKVNEK